MRQLVERADNRGPGGGTRRQLAGVVRGRSGEVGTLAEQPGQPVVGPRPQLVGEGAESLAGRLTRGHPSHATRRHHAGRRTLLPAREV